ncbi:MAG: hypothetical protein HKN45_11885 [Flavobacteriales bacterium]|nr:hypothetical protein [Flavobacteriales bacterium]
MNTTVTQRNSDLDLFFRAAFSIDLVLFAYIKGNLKLLLVNKEETSPHHQKGLPGMLIFPNEDTDQAIIKLSAKYIGTTDFYHKQLRAFTEVGRHPEGRVITIAYYGLISVDKLSDDIEENQSWYNVDDLPPLTYDHEKIIKVARHKFCKGLLRHPTVFELLPEHFVLSDMIRIYEQAFRRKLDSPNFRRQARDSGLITPIGEKKSAEGQLGRRPQLYTTVAKSSKARIKESIGFNLQVA